MDFLHIIDNLNELAKSTTTFKDLPYIRVNIRGSSRPGSRNIFSKKSTFPGECYAFHSGSRSETQFNVGLEYYQERELFRYGLGFSLTDSQSEKDPINALTPRIRALNHWLSQHPSELSDLRLWHYDEGPISQRSQDFEPTEIPASWITWGNFIFLGQYLDKPMDDIEPSDLSQIVELFDRLMPVYEYVESNFENYRASNNGDRIARLCWNDNGWVCPSGRVGKSKDGSTHEAKYGYGHEEWLGDVTKTIGGYHYAFLEPFRNEEKAVGNTYNVELYTIDSRTKKRYVVGSITNAQIIGADLAQAITDQYKEKGWYQHMEDQAKRAGAQTIGFSHWKGVDLFNVRFHPDDLYLYPQYLETQDKTITEPKHYTLLYKKGAIETLIPTTGNFIFIPDTNDQNVEHPSSGKSTSGNPANGKPTTEDPDTAAPEDTDHSDLEISAYERIPGPIEIVWLHKKIRDRLKAFLIRQHGKCVAKEHPTGFGTLIDLVRKEGTRNIFYEIKTYNSLKLCIREALGQILEYSHWPGADHADELIIVSHNKMTDEARQYLKHLRDKYNICLYYQQFLWEEQSLSEKF